MQLCNENTGLRRMTGMLLALLLALSAGLTGCGGGGGGGGSTGPSGNVTVTGLVLVAETGNPPSPAATIAINGHTATTGTDGTFTLSNVAATATAATVTAAGEMPRTLTLVLTDTTGTYDLGNIFISSGGYTASASGTIVTPVKGLYQAVGGANVTIAGSTVLSGADGSFSITGLPVGLGSDPTVQIGTVQAKEFVDKPITTQFPFVTGANPLGQIVIQSPVGATPGVPYTITGKVEHGTTGLPTIPVTITYGSTQLTTQTDANGNYYFWVVPGAYTILAVESANVEMSVHVTVNTTNTVVTAPPINF